MVAEKRGLVCVWLRWCAFRVLDGEGGGGVYCFVCLMRQRVPASCFSPLVPAFGEGTFSCMLFYLPARFKPLLWHMLLVRMSGGIYLFFSFLTSCVCVCFDFFLSVYFGSVLLNHNVTLTL